MSLVVVYHDRSKAVIVSDDRVSAHDLATLEKHAVDGKVSKILVLPRNLVFGSVGRLDVSKRLFRGTAAMCGKHDLDFEALVDCLPGIMRHVWRSRAPLPEGLGMHKQDSLLIGTDSDGKIRCCVFLADKNFEPIETTASPGNRVAVIGGFDAVDEAMLNDFSRDVGLRGERQRAPWIAAKIRDLINSISAVHPASIGQASYFAALNREGHLALPSEFSAPPDVPLPDRELAAPGQSATAGRFFLGSITTPASGGPDTEGNDDGGVGAQGGSVTTCPMSVTPAPTFVNSAGGTGASLTGVNNPFDNVPSTYVELIVTGNTIFNQVIYSIGGPSGSVPARYSAAQLKVVYSIAQNDLAPGSAVIVSGLQAGLVTFNDGGGATLMPFSGSVFTNNNTGTVAPTELVWDIPVGTNLAQIMVYIDATSQVSFSSGKLKIRIHSVELLVTD